MDLQKIGYLKKIMSTTPPSGVIDRTSLSDAWLAVLKLLTTPGACSDAPLAVSFTGFNADGFPLETKAVRERLDQELKKRGAESTEICAAMIFPLGNAQLMEMRLNRAVSVDELTDYYLSSVFPRLRTMNAGANGRGTYFFRMVNFGANPKVEESKGINQLGELINAWLRNSKIVQSRLQIAIRDPGRDLNGNPRPFFPCLQQVSFAYDRSGGISVTGYYPTQYILDRAYGNSRASFSRPVGIPWPETMKNPIRSEACPIFAAAASQAAPSSAPSTPERSIIGTIASDTRSTVQPPVNKARQLTGMLGENPPFF
jgi:hypothetical protein